MGFQCFCSGLKDCREDFRGSFDPPKTPAVPVALNSV